ncbi:MAG: hypothetical protein H7833_10735 [Magnetococcus sp. DMHC-1]|nr:hypothetical protein [Magnetococcales bacterium]
MQLKWREFPLDRARNTTPSLQSGWQEFSFGVLFIRFPIEGVEPLRIERKIGLCNLFQVQVEWVKGFHPRNNLVANMVNDFPLQGFHVWKPKKRSPFGRRDVQLDIDFHDTPQLFWPITLGDLDLEFICETKEAKCAKPMDLLLLTPDTTDFGMKHS